MTRKLPLELRVTRVTIKAHLIGGAINCTNVEHRRLCAVVILLARVPRFAPIIRHHRGLDTSSMRCIEKIKMRTLDTSRGLHEEIDQSVNPALANFLARSIAELIAQYSSGSYL